jgi:hypothetical protein
MGEESQRITQALHDFNPRRSCGQHKLGPHEPILLPNIRKIKESGFFFGEVESVSLEGFAPFAHRHPLSEHASCRFRQFWKESGAV